MGIVLFGWSRVLICLVGWSLKAFNQEIISDLHKNVTAACHQSFRSFSLANYQFSPWLPSLNADDLVMTTWNHVFISPAPVPSLSLSSGRRHRSSASQRLQTGQIPDVKICASRQHWALLTHFTELPLVSFALICFPSLPFENFTPFTLHRTCWALKMFARTLGN